MLQSSFSFLSLGFLAPCLLILSCTEREESSTVVAVQTDSGELSPDSIEAEGLLDFMNEKKSAFDLLFYPDFMLKMLTIAMLCFIAAHPLRGYKAIAL